MQKLKDGLLLGVGIGLGMGATSILLQAIMTTLVFLAGR